MKKQTMIPLAALALVAVGGITAGLSQFSPTAVLAQSPSAQTQQVAEKSATDKEVADDNKQEENFTSSIRTQDQANDQETNDDGAEAKTLAPLAKITADQAKAAAQKQVGGTATSVQLENEDGNVVYAVTVGGKEVKVDAGNGKVLHTEAADAAGAEGAEGVNESESK